MKTLYDEKQLFATLDDAGICRVELNNPDQLNALNTTMAQGAVELAAIIRSSAARVVIFSGRGRAFSAGGDLAYLIELTHLPKEQSAAAMLKFYRSYLALFTLPLPTIAHINGACVGAGFCLALACDMRFAVSGSKVGMNFVRIGLNPGMAAEFWAQGENSPLIREMLLTGKIYSSSEPRLKLLFNQVASPQEIALTVEECAAAIAANSPQSIALSLELLRNRHLDFETLIDKEAAGQGVCMSTGEIAAAVAAQKKIEKFRFRI
ncbi:MAG: enoyl-CoA hydratase/isomerase family protein [Spirochaetes bacterium]|nr:enoyl-CoA hydratase/isomerase family protein [Spirochaetota bacterium]